MKTKIFASIVALLISCLPVFSQEKKESKCDIKMSVTGNEIGYLEKDPPVNILVQNDRNECFVTWTTPSGYNMEKSEMWATEEGVYILIVSAKDGTCKTSMELAFPRLRNQKDVNDVNLVRKADPSKEDVLEKFYKINSQDDIVIKDGKIIITKNDDTPITVSIFDSTGTVAFKTNNLKNSRTFDYPLIHGDYTIFVNTGFLKRIKI